MLVTSAVFLTLTVVSFHLDLEWWYRLGFIGLLALCPVGVAEVATQRVELSHAELVVVDHLRRRTFARAEVEAVTWAKGAGASIRLADGRWVRLPQVGTSPQGVTNTIRAWIKRSGRTPGASS